MITEWNKVLGLLNRGFGYSYIGRIFDCSPEVIKEFEDEQRKKGRYLKEFSARIEKEIFPVPVKRNYSPRTYIRLFDDYKNVTQAVEMLQAGYTYRQIGNALGCDRTSVMSFHYRKMREGIVFENHKKRREEQDRDKLVWNEDWVMAFPVFSIKELEKQSGKKSLSVKTESEINTGDIITSLYDGEKINAGRTSYAKYLSDYKNKTKKGQKERLLKARKTIEKLRKWRKKNGMNDPIYSGGSLRGIKLL